MKKIFLLVLILSLSLIGKSQGWPIVQNLGSDSTLVSIGRNFGGGIKGNLINTSYSDTTSANLQRIRQYAGGQIFTTGDTSLWLRSIGANKWVKLAGSAGSTNIYNSNGSFTGNRTASGANLYYIAFDAVSSFRAEANAGTGKISSVLVGTDSILFQPSDAIFIIDSLPSGASTDSVLVWTQATGRVKKRNASSFVTSNAWGLTGNSGTTAGTNFIGTADAVDLVFKTNSNEIARFFGDDTYRFRFGLSPIVTGNYSAAFGREDSATGAIAFATGFKSSASGDQSVAMGNGSKASGNSAVSIGSSNIASATASIALGLNNISSAEASFASGRADTASGNYSFVSGHESKASATYSFAHGHEAKATGVVSIAMGNGVVSSGYNATTFGRTYTNSKDTSFAFGVAGSAGLGTRILELTRDSAIISPTVATLISSSLQYSAGSPGAGKVLTSDATGNATWSTAPSALTLPISSLTASTGTNSITVGHPQTWNYNGIQSTTGHTFTSNSITSGTIMDITGISSFLAAGNEGLNIAISGANATNGITATGARISVTNTNATSGTNNALDLTASGATTANNAINIAAGAIALNGSAGTTGQFLTSAGASGLPTWTTPTVTSPAGNFGNLQINRNSAFATPASDSLDWESSTGLSIIGRVNINDVNSGEANGANGLRIIATTAGLGAGVQMGNSTTGSTNVWQFFSKGATLDFAIGRANVQDNILMGGTSGAPKTYFPGPNGGATMPAGNFTILADAGTNAAFVPIIAKLNASQTADAFQVQNSAGTALTVINSSGSVGIGTSTPTSLLHVNGVGQFGTAGSTLGKILMSGNTSGTVTLQTAAAAGTWTGTLPTNDGDANQVLTTDGSGVMSWTTPSGGTPSGNFGNIQLNRNGAFATPGSDSLDFESATGLSVKGDILVSNSSNSNITVASTSGAATAWVTYKAQGGNWYSWAHDGGSNQFRLYNAALSTYANWDYTTGNLALGQSTTAATAKLMLGAGTASANTAPLKFTTGTSLTTAEAGAMEYTTPQLFFTNGGGQRQEIPQIQQSRVSTQFDKTSSTSLSNVTGLTSTLVAGKTYRFEAVLYTTSNVAGGVQFAVAGTATATNIIYEAVVIDANVNAAQTRATALATAVGAVTAVTNALCKITGTITVNAAGTLTIQFAQNASNGTASSVLVGSTFVITEML